MPISLSDMHKFFKYLTLFLALLIAHYEFLIEDKDYKAIFSFWQDEEPIKRPLNKPIIDRIVINKNEIKYYANKYSISPVAIAGIALAEASMHTGPVNQFEEYYVRTFLLDNSDEYLEKLCKVTLEEIDQKKMANESDKEFEFRLKRGLIWSIGFTQIRILKAISLESELAPLEKRRQRSIREVIQSLLDDKKNIEYCAFELSKIRNVYNERAGVDISDKPEILATLFNTGRYEEVVIEYYFDSSKIPKPNDLGAYVLKYKNEIMCLLEQEQCNP